ncbi:MAG: FAD-dependent oxidoreductase [Leptospirales bacterium]|nr:FAD-dependent oxidoreductase [Leptospirales bacterium]
MPQTAKLVEARNLNPFTRLLKFQTSEPVNFVGGNWVMVNSGLTTAEGKPAKRAYSIISPDSNQNEFMLIVREITGGLASKHLHGIEPGDGIEWSGPYGKIFKLQDGDTGPILIVATDTGITAALGIVRGAQAQPLLGKIRLIWLVENDSYFVSADFVREILPAGLGRFEVHSIPDAKEVWGRTEAARAAITPELVVERPALVFLSGDGNIIQALSDVCQVQGVDAAQIRVEPFFNAEKKKPSPGIPQS